MCYNVKCRCMPSCYRFVGVLISIPAIICTTNKHSFYHFLFPPSMLRCSCRLLRCLVGCTFLTSPIEKQWGGGACKYIEVPFMSKYLVSWITFSPFLSPFFFFFLATHTHTPNDVFIMAFIILEICLFSNKFIRGGGELWKNSQTWQSRIINLSSFVIQMLPLLWLF